MYDVVMIGSSIFEFWGKPNWGEVKVANHAVRSTASQYWLDYDLNTLPLSKSIIVYCGSNDLVFGVPTDAIIDNIKALLNKLKKQYPQANIGYFSILKCPQKSVAGQLNTIDQINLNIKEFCSSNIQYIEFNEFIENDPRWYIEDGLHITAQAYAKIDEHVSETIAHLLKQK